MALLPADDMGRLNVRLIFDRQHRPARHPGKGRRIDHANCQHSIGQAGAKQTGDHNRQHQGGKGKENIHKAHHDTIKTPPNITSQHAGCHPQDNRQADR